MVWTAAQTNDFFLGRLGLTNEGWAGVQAEGITSAEDLVEFEKEQFETMQYNFRRPAAGGAVIHVSAMSMKRLKNAANMMRYYSTVGHAAQPGNTTTVAMKDFEIQWKALLEKKEKDQPEVPKISRNLSIMAWTELFTDHLSQCIGAQKAPLTYVTRDQEQSANPCPDAAAGKPHAVDFQNIEEELASRASHTHVLFIHDNQQVFDKLEEATRGTSYATSIKAFARRKDGRAAYRAILSQHAGDDKWVQEIQKSEHTLQQDKWRGNGSYLLEKHCAKHRKAHTLMEQGAEHVPYQLPDGGTKVRHLLESIETGDAELQAAKASIKADKSADGPLYDFAQR